VSTIGIVGVAPANSWATVINGVVRSFLAPTERKGVDQQNGPPLKHTLVGSCQRKGTSQRHRNAAVTVLGGYMWIARA